MAAYLVFHIQLIFFLLAINQKKLIVIKIKSINCPIFGYFDIYHKSNT